MDLVDVMTAPAGTSAPASEGILEQLHDHYPLNLTLLSGRYEQLLARAEGRSERVRLKRAVQSIREAGLSSDVQIHSRCSRSGMIYRLHVTIKAEDGHELRELAQGIMQDQGLPVAVDVHDKLILLGEQVEHLHGGTGLTFEQLGWECLGIRRAFHYQQDEWMTTETVARWAEVTLDFTDLDNLGEWIRHGHTPEEAQAWVDVHPDLHRYWLTQSWISDGFSAEQVAEWVQVHPGFHDPHTLRDWNGSGLDIDDARQISNLLDLRCGKIPLDQIRRLAAYKRHHGTVEGFSG